MLHINIVTVNSGWILQKIAERTMMAGKDIPDVMFGISHFPNYAADVNYYVDMYNCYKGYKTKCDIGYFTHAHENSPEWLKGLMDQTTAWHMEGIVSMNERYTQMLRDIGYPDERLITLTPGQTHDTFPLKKIRIGIVSRGGYEGYGQQFMEQLFSSGFDFSPFQFHFLGNGWEALIPIAEQHKVDIVLNDDTDFPYELYPQFYYGIDYLLIPGLWTAGPMSMQEALSMGVPVIGADVGFVGYEFGADYVFEPNNVQQLIGILEMIQGPVLARRAEVQGMTWERHARDVVEFIKKMAAK